MLHLTQNRNIKSIKEEQNSQWWCACVCFLYICRVKWIYFAVLHQIHLSSLTACRDFLIVTVQIRKLLILPPQLALLLINRANQIFLNRGETSFFISSIKKKIGVPKIHFLFGLIFRLFYKSRKKNRCIEINFLFISTKCFNHIVFFLFNSNDGNDF